LWLDSWRDRQQTHQFLTATLAAPPSVARLAVGRSTGIGASGDRRLALPLT